MAADGLIVLGLDVSQTQANIQAELDGILNNTKTKKIILKTAIEKAETEKQINAIVGRINKKAVEIGVETDPKSVSAILAAQQKIASIQAKLNEQMREYRNTAKEIGITLNKNTWNAFNHAVSSGDFTKANEILKSAKKQIEEYRVSVQKMNADTTLTGSVSSLVEQFSRLKNVNAETQKRINLLKADLIQFENAGNIQTKLSAYKRLCTMVENLSKEFKGLSFAERLQNSDLNIQKKIDDARSSLEIFKIKYDDIGTSESAQKVAQSISDLDMVLNKVNSGAEGGALRKQWDAITIAINNAKRAVAEYNAEYGAKRGDMNLLSNIANRSESLQTAVVSSGLKGSGINKLSEELIKAKNDAKSLKIQLDKTATSDSDYQGLIEKIDELRRRFQALNKEAKIFEDAGSLDNFKTNLEKSRQKVEEYGKTFSAIQSNTTFKDEFEKLKNKLDGISTPTELKSWNNEFETFNTKVKQAGLNTESFGDKIKNSFKNFTMFFGASRMIYTIVMGFQQMIDNVKALDAAMINLKKVTNESDSAYDSFLSNAKTKAIELGTTVSDLVNATANFSKLGFSLPESEELGQLATIYANVGELESIDEATNSLISTMKGFGLETSDASSILDKFNEVGNNFAITSGDIGEALRRSASSMSAANNTIDETIALITAANTVVQDSASVGTAFKTVSMRIRGATTEMEAAGLDMEGMASSTASLREEIKALSGVDIMLDETTFKSTYQIIKEIAEKWNEMTDIQQASVTELIAGKRQGNIISAVMENFDIAEAALESSLGSAGSAMNEYSVWLDGIEAKTNQFKAAFESLSTTMINGDFLKNIIEFGAQAITSLDKIIQSLGGVGNALMIVTSALSLLNLEKSAKILKTVFTIITSPVPKVINLYTKLRYSWEKGKEAGEGFIGTLKGFSSAFSESVGAATAAAAAFSAIIAAIGIGIAVYQNHKQKLEEARQAAEDAANSHNELVTSLDDYKNRIVDLRKEIDSGNLSEEEAYNKRQELLSIQKELIEQFGAEAEGIRLVTGEIDQQTAAIENLKKSDWERFEQENTAAINDAVDLFTDFDIGKIDWWKGVQGGDILVNLPSMQELNDAFKELEIDAPIQEFYDKVQEEFEKADLDFDVPSKITGTFGTESKSGNIYKVLETYRAVYDIIQKVGKEYFKEDVSKYLANDLEEISERINLVNGAIEENEEAFNTHVEGVLQYNSEYSERWGNILAAQKKYNEAIASGDEKAVEEAVKDMEAAKKAWENAGFSDNAVNQYVEEFFEQFEGNTLEYEFNIKLKASLVDPDDDFDTLLKEAAERFQDKSGRVDVDAVLNAGIEYEENTDKSNLSEEQQAYADLKSVADEYGLSVEELLGKMEELDAIELKNIKTGATYFDSINRVRKSYEDLQSAVDNAVNVQTAMGKVFADGTHLTEESYQSLVTLAGSETALADCIDTANGYMVTNVEKLQDIIAASEGALRGNIKLAQSHERFNYHELVKQLDDVTNGIEEYDDATLDSIGTILDQIDATKQQIAQYKLLEERLLGATNAFTEMENAQKIDEAADYSDDLANMIQTLFDAYEKKEFGGEAFWTAFEALIPEDVYKQFEDVGDQIDAGWDYLNNALSRYYSFDNGNISIDFDNIKNFVEDGLKTAFGDSTVFTGTLENFELNPQIESIQDLAEAMNLTTTEAFALANAISKYTAGNEDFLSDLISSSYSETENLENQIYACDEALAELLEKQTELGESGKVGTEEWYDLQTEIDETKTKMEEFRSEARKNITANIEINAKIEEKQQEVDDLKATLDDLDEDDANYSVTMDNYLEAQNQLASLIQQKYDLGEPTEVTVQVALEQVQTEISKAKEELNKIADYDGETYHAKVEVDQSQVDALVQKIESLESEESGIKFYAGINEEDTLETLNSIENFPIHDKKFSVEMEKYTETKNQLEKIRNLINGIQSKNVYINTFRNDNPSDPSGAAHVKGTAHQSGNWGTPTKEKNALVGELEEELVVDPNTGTYQTVGTHGAELIDLPKGAIVFNHRQTEGILKNRRINSRGKAYAEGNAHFTLIDRTYSRRKDNSSAGKNRSNTSNSKVDVNVDVSGDIDLEEKLKETLERMEEEINKIISSYEHDIFLLEKNNGSADEIVAIYKKMQQKVHSQAEEYRKLGLSENSEYIINLQKQWWDYRDAIQEVIIASYDDAVSNHKNAVTLTENWLENAIESANYFDISQYTNDIVGRYRDMQNIIHEQAEYYRSLGFSDTSDEISQLSDLWWDYYDEIKNISAEAWSKVVDNANDALDSIQGMYDSLKSAAQEYAEYGGITVDTLQEILSYGIENLSYLRDENGVLVVNEENIQKVIAARTQQMAIESALNYIQQLRAALTNNDTAALLHLTEASDAAASSTWDLVYAQLQLLGLNGEQYDKALQRINAMRSLADSAVISVERIGGSAKETLENTSTALEDLLKYVEDMIRQEVENQIDALEQQIEDYQTIIDLQKESLDLEREKDQYTKDVTEKTKSIAELQARIAQLDLDDSREAQAEKRKLQEQLAEEQSELAETQADHAYEATSDALDEMLEAYDKEKQDEIKILQDSISSAEKIYQLAIDRINNHWDDLYKDLSEWNYQYGNTVQSELESAWNAASEAVERYNGYLNAVAATQERIASFETGDFHIVGDTGDYNTGGGSTIDSVREIVSEMKANSQAHHNASVSEQDRLEKRNRSLADDLEKLIGRTLVLGPDGVWYLDRIGGARLYSTYPYSSYHTGGVVGDKSTKKQDEMFTLLKKGEAVLTEPQQNVVYRALDISETWAGKLGFPRLYQNMNGGSYAETRAWEIVKRDIQQAQSMVGNSGMIQNVGDISVPVQVMVTEKLDKNDLKRLSREIGNIAGEEIVGAFFRRGKSTLNGSRLRP